MIQNRQGDIFFVKLNSPAIKKQDAEGRNAKGILAEGEVTGHCHAIKPMDLDKVNIFLDANGKLIVQVKPDKEVTIQHQEHEPVILTEGDWEIRRQREYEPLGWRQVAD